MNNRLKLALFILLIGAFSAAIFSPQYNNSITGKDVFTKVEITDIIPSNCSFNLTSGWNYVSFYCISSSTPRSEVLSSINNSYSRIFTYNAFDTVDPWKSYNPELPNWTVQQLNYMGRTSGYIILMTEEANYEYSGYKRSSIVQLHPGWNLVGYPSNNSVSINESLNGLLYTLVLTYEDGSILSYSPNSSNNDITYFEPYKAYWINSTASQNWLLN